MYIGFQTVKTEKIRSMTWKLTFFLKKSFKHFSVLPNSAPIGLHLCAQLFIFLKSHHF